MEEYHKINAPFKRNNDGDKKLIMGDWALAEFSYLAGNLWEFTEKVDGTNIRVRLTRIGDEQPVLKVDYAGRTNNAQIPPHLVEYLERVFPTWGHWRRDITAEPYTERNHEILAWMIEKDLTEVVLHGEGYGPKIQGGGKYREDAAFVLFDVKIGDTWLMREAVDDIAGRLGIGSVPILGKGTLWDAIKIVQNGLESKWGNFEAEGIVARPLIPLFDRQGKRIITKIKGRDFRVDNA